MSTAQTIFESYSRPHSKDCPDGLVAFPSFGALFERFKTALGNSVQAAIEEQPDTGLWHSPSNVSRVQTKTVRDSERCAQDLAEPPGAPLAPHDRQPLNDGWAQIIEHAYQTRFHSNGTQHA